MVVFSGKENKKVPTQLCLLNITLGAAPAQGVLADWSVSLRRGIINEGNSQGYKMEKHEVERLSANASFFSEAREEQGCLEKGSEKCPGKYRRTLNPLQLPCTQNKHLLCTHNKGHVWNLWEGVYFITPKSAVFIGNRTTVIFTFRMADNWYYIENTLGHPWVHSGHLIYVLKGSSVFFCWLEVLGSNLAR